jgi:thiol-disulfide isomerase/thioredoxin
MKKSFIFVLAVIAGLTGLAIGIAAGRSRQKAIAPAVHGSLATAHKAGNAKSADPQLRQMNVIRFASNPQTAPAFLVRDIEGNVVSTADWHGKVVLLNFWATWCPPCREEIPELIELESRYKDRLQIVGVSLDDDGPDEVEKFAKNKGINYPIVMASREMLVEYGGVPALPTLFVVNPDGKVVQKHVGLYPTFLYETEVRALLGMPIEASVETFEDRGQIFLKNAALATELPDVDFTGLTPEMKKAALKRLNSEGCNCGCRLTLAQCRINDTPCTVSRGIAAKIVKEIAAPASTGSEEPSAPPPASAPGPTSN